MWTLGSLFDGIGGFPLAAVHNGIKPVWASEVEAFPIRVTKIHFPEIEHLEKLKLLLDSVQRRGIHIFNIQNGGKQGRRNDASPEKIPGTLSP